MYINFLIKTRTDLITEKFITIIETIIHNSDINENYLLNYIYYVLIKSI